MRYMAEKVPKSFRFDAELWSRVESRAAELGQKHVTFVERALESALGRSGDGSSAPGTNVGDASAARGSAPASASSRAPVEKESSEAKGPRSRKQADPGPVGSAGNSSEPVRSAAPSRQAKQTPAQIRQAALNKAKGL
jgi:hypothetical protein